jgi:hypothetical protein
MAETFFAACSLQAASRCATCCRASDLVVALAVTLNETASKPAATVVISVFMGTPPLNTKTILIRPTGSDYFPDNLFRNVPRRDAGILLQE